MDGRARWRRVGAEHWVQVWGMVATTVLLLVTTWTLFSAWLAGVPLVADLPAALLAGRALVVAPLVACGVLPLLLFHPDSRARLGTATPVLR